MESPLYRHGRAGTRADVQALVYTCAHPRAAAARSALSDDTSAHVSLSDNVELYNICSDSSPDQRTAHRHLCMEGLTRTTGGDNGFVQPIVGVCYNNSGC